MTIPAEQRKKLEELAIKDRDIRIRDIDRDECSVSDSIRNAYESGAEAAWELATKAEREKIRASIQKVMEDWKYAGDMIKVYACEYLLEYIIKESSGV